MKLSSELPLWVAVPLRVVLYLFVMFVLYSIATVFVSGRLANNVAACSAGKRAHGIEALAYAKQMMACLDHKNSFLENFAYRRYRAAIDAMPNNPKELAGRWSSAQPRCQYEFELRETGEFVAEPITCSISNQRFEGQWGVHDGQMVWLYAQNGLWRPDINPMDIVDRDFFLLTEQDGTRTRFTRIGPIVAPVAAPEGAGTQSALPERAAEANVPSAPRPAETGEETEVPATDVGAENATPELDQTSDTEEPGPGDSGASTPPRGGGAHEAEDK